MAATSLDPDEALTGLLTEFRGMCFFTPLSWFARYFPKVPVSVSHPIKSAVACAVCVFGCRHA
jgi:hypothetical protein